MKFRVGNDVQMPILAAVQNGRFHIGIAGLTFRWLMTQCINCINETTLHCQCCEGISRTQTRLTYHVRESSYQLERRGLKEMID